MGNEELRPYGEYKRARQEWLSSIPARWKEAKAKRLFVEMSIKNCANEELLSATQNKGVLPRSILNTRVVMPSGNLDTFKLVQEGNFVISLRSFQGGIEFSEIEGIVSPAYTVFRINENYSSYDYKMYYKYLFKTKIFISVLNTLISGIRDGKNINYSDFIKLTLPIPPHKTIEKVTKLIKQLEELKKQFDREFILLIEYRTRLTSDVVTGKVDVRDIAIEGNFIVESDFTEVDDEEAAIGAENFDGEEVEEA